LLFPLGLFGICIAYAAASVHSQSFAYLPAVCVGHARSSATTSGRLTQDETWSGNLLLTGDVEIPPRITLTVQPGTTVRFTAQSDDQHGPDEYAPLDPTTYPATMIHVLVRGALDARGTALEPITFTSSSETPGELDWQSIMIEDAGTATLEHVVIEHSPLASN